MAYREAVPPLFVYSACVVLIGSFSFGLVIGFTSPTLPHMEEEAIFVDSQSYHFAGLATFGMVIGSLVGGPFIEKYGRIAALIAFNVPHIVGFVMIASLSKVPLLYLGRFLTGVSSGGFLLAVPTYLAEVSPRGIRGFICSLGQLSITIGILFAYTLGIAVSWRTLAICFTLSAPIMILMLNYVPESPRWLILQGRRRDAAANLKVLRMVAADAEEECREIEESVDPQHKDSAIGLSEFLQPSLWQPLMVAVGLLVLQQLTGINVVMFYSTTFFRQAGLGSYADYGTMVVGVVQVAATVVACRSVDQYGRKRLLLIGGFGQAVSTVVLGLCFLSDPSSPTSADATSTGSTGTIALCAMTVYIVCFAVGWGPVPMLVTSEVFPLRARGVAASIACVLGSIMAVVLSAGFDSFKYWLGGVHAVFWFFSVCCFLSISFVQKLVPETKGRTLEDIELFFLSKTLQNNRVV